MSTQENSEDIINQENVENTDLQKVTEENPSDVVSEEGAAVSPEGEQETSSPFKKFETWLIVALFVLPLGYLAYNYLSKDAAPKDDAAEQERNVAAMIADFEQKANANPTFENLLALGIVYESNNRAQQALDPLQKALALNPKSPLVYNNLGFAYIGIRNYDEAISYLEKAILLDSAFQLAKNNLAWAKSEKDKILKNIETLEKTPEKDRNAEFYIKLGLEYQALRNFNKCVECWKKAVEVDPKNVLAHNNVGVGYMFIEKYDEAIASFKKTLEISPDYQLGKNNLAWAEGEKKKAEEAKKAKK